MPRLFVAIEIPKTIKDDLTKLTRELPVAHWVPADQNHLTLRFIGDVGPQACAEIKTALSNLRFVRFSLALGGVGHFPPGGHPRVLWVGVESCPMLIELQMDLERALVGTGIAPEVRPFAPHLTLARLKETVPAAVYAFELRHGGLAYAPFEVSEAILFSSVLSSHGATHQKELVIRSRQA